VARTWLSIRADLIEGHGEQYWPRPGRIFAAARSHTFKCLPLVVALSHFGSWSHRGWPPVAGA